jgi:mono/diheme cytochrome c family protein
LKGQGDYGPAIASNPTLVQPVALAAVVRHGRKTMPPVGNNWTADQMRALRAYIKSNIYTGATSGG